MINDALDLSEFKRVAAQISKTVEDETLGVNLVSVGYEVEGLTVGVACSAPDAVVISLGDSRISLSHKQLAVLRDLIQVFSDSMELT